MVYLKELRTAQSSPAGEGKVGKGSGGTEKEERGGSTLRRRQDRRWDVWVLPLLLPLFGLSWGELFKLWCGLTCSSCPPLPGPARHLAAHRWQHYDGLGIVIQDACHLFTSRPSLISHHRPYNLAGTHPPGKPCRLPLPPLPCCQTRRSRQHHTLQPPSLPLPPYIPELNTVNTFNALIYVLCWQSLGRGD